MTVSFNVVILCSTVFMLNFNLKLQIDHKHVNFLKPRRISENLEYISQKPVVTLFYVVVFVFKLLPLSINFDCFFF